MCCRWVKPNHPTCHSKFAAHKHASQPAQTLANMSQQIFTTACAVNAQPAQKQATYCNKTVQIAQEESETVFPKAGQHVVGQTKTDETSNSNICECTMFNDQHSSNIEGVTFARSFANCSSPNATVQPVLKHTGSTRQVQSNKSSKRTRQPVR